MDAGKGGGAGIKPEGKNGNPGIKWPKGKEGQGKADWARTTLGRAKTRKPAGGGGNEDLPRKGGEKEKVRWVCHDRQKKRNRPQREQKRGKGGAKKATYEEQKKGNFATIRPLKWEVKVRSKFRFSTDLTRQRPGTRERGAKGTCPAEVHPSQKKNRRG